MNPVFYMALLFIGSFLGSVMLALGSAYVLMRVKVIPEFHDDDQALKFMLISCTHMIIVTVGLMVWVVTMTPGVDTLTNANFWVTLGLVISLTCHGLMLVSYLRRAGFHLLSMDDYFLYNNESYVVHVDKWHRLDMKFIDMCRLFLKKDNHIKVIKGTTEYTVPIYIQKGSWQKQPLLTLKVTVLMDEIEFRKLHYRLWSKEFFAHEIQCAVDRLWSRHLENLNMMSAKIEVPVSVLLENCQIGFEQFRTQLLKDFAQYLRINLFNKDFMDQNLSFLEYTAIAYVAEIA